MIIRRYEFYDRHERYKPALECPDIVIIQIAPAKKNEQRATTDPNTLSNLPVIVIVILYDCQ